MKGTFIMKKEIVKELIDESNEMIKVLDDESKEESPERGFLFFEN